MRYRIKVFYLIRSLETKEPEETLVCSFPVGREGSVSNLTSQYFAFCSPLGFLVYGPTTSGIKAKTLINPSGTAPSLKSEQNAKGLWKMWKTCDFSQ